MQAENWRVCVISSNIGVNPNISVPHCLENEHSFASRAGGRKTLWGFWDGFDCGYSQPRHTHNRGTFHKHALHDHKLVLKFATLKAEFFKRTAKFCTCRLTLRFSSLFRCKLHCSLFDSWFHHKYKNFGAYTRFGDSIINLFSRYKVQTWVRSKQCSFLWSVGLFLEEMLRPNSGQNLIYLLRQNF